MTLAPKQEKLEYCLFESNLPAVVEMTRREAAMRVLQGANIFRTQLQKNLAGKRTGRRYALPGTGQYYLTPKGKKRRIPRTGKYYTASRKGEYPAVRFGGMRKSLRIIRDEAGMTVEAITGTHLMYGPPLESIRPFFLRTFTEVKQQIKDIIGGTW